MAAIGGPIDNITLNGRYFSIAEDAESNRKIGGFENEVQPNGDGTGRLIKTRVPWGADGLTISCDEENKDQQFLQNLANLNDFYPITIGYVSGAIWQGNGQIVGEIAFSSKNATTPTAFQGTETFTKQ